MSTMVARERSSQEDASAIVADATDLAAIEAFLQTLARAIRQFHTYPSTSPQCIEAIEESQRALTLITLDALVCVVSPRELRIGGCAIGRDTAIEQEVARRLREARCETITIDRSATTRDLARLCTELAARRSRDAAPLDERLRKHGVDRINVSSTYQPVFVDVDTTADSCVFVEQDRQRDQAQPSSGRVTHMYPPDKGWVRLDPGLPLTTVTLSGLARLVDDPASLADMLARLSGDIDETRSPADALEQRCEDVARLYASLDPAVARARYSRLAAAVLALDSQRRQRLLANKVLPGLVDGRPEGDLLHSFPDVDLADALSLLLDVETAAPELLTAALDRLNLSADRHLALAPLLEDRIRARGAEARVTSQKAAALEERTRQLIRVVHGDVSLDDFAAFDLRTDDETEGIIASTNGTLHATDLTDAQLGCISQLIALSANAESAEPLLRQAMRLLGELERTQSTVALAAGFEALQQTTVRDPQSNVAGLIGQAIETFYTPVRFERLVVLYDAGDEQRAVATRLVAAVGANLTAAVVQALKEHPGDKRVLQLVFNNAATFAPAIARLLDQLPVAQRIAALRALGSTGRGLESHIGRQLTHQNEGVVHEALAALAGIGSEEAAELVTRHLQRGGDVRASAEELLWQFAPSVTRHCLRTLFRQRQFVTDNTAIALRLLQRIDRRDASKLGDVLSPLKSFRFRFWNPSLARVGRQAAALLH